MYVMLIILTEDLWILMQYVTICIWTQSKSKPVYRTNYTYSDQYWNLFTVFLGSTSLLSCFLLAVQTKLYSLHLSLTDWTRKETNVLLIAEKVKIDKNSCHKRKWTSFALRMTCKLLRRFNFEISHSVFAMWLLLWV